MEKIYQLHLEIRMDNESDIDILRKYGKVNKGISRDILVPSNMTLYSLHYAIQKCFGWNNSHLHHFQLPDSILERLTDHQFSQWMDLCGLYFRFPYGDSNAAFSDIYWNDDYQEWMNPNTWFRSKYNPPYSYEGTLEHFMHAKGELEKDLKAFETVHIPPSFEEYQQGLPGKDIKLVDAKIEEVLSFFNYQLLELLERLTIEELFTTKYEDINNQELTNIITYSKQQYDQYLEEYTKYTQNKELVLNELSRKRKNRAQFYILNQSIQQDLDQIYAQTDLKMIPITKELVYKYDYGDGWEVDVECKEVYTYNNEVFMDHQGKLVLSEELMSVYNTHKPICIEQDGLNVLDDVGGIYGYCRMLEEIQKRTEESIELKEWARSQGWSGRFTKPKNIL